MTAKRSMTRLRTRLDTRYLPDKPDEPKTKPGSSLGIVGVNIPSRRGRRKAAASIDSTRDADSETRKPPTKKRKKSTDASQSGGITTSPSGKNKGTKTTPPPSNKSGATLSAADGSEGDRDHEDEEDFDDLFDISRPPTNWNEAHARSMNMTDVIPQLDFVRNTRARESARDTSVEEKWEQENVVLQTEGSTNGTPDISAFLRSVHIPKDHRAHVFIPLSHFKFLRTMATYWGIFSELFLAEDPEPKSNQPEQNWEQVLNKDDYMSESLFATKKTEITL